MKFTFKNPFILVFTFVFISFASEKNIIFFITDDQSPTLGCYGDPVAKTPAIDSLAEDGTLFRMLLLQLRVVQQADLWL